jgi:phosphoglycerate dehydrogenase-like enzyme
MASRGRIRSVVVLHATAGDFRDGLVDRFPDVAFEWVQDPASVAAVLDRLEPDCVFSIRQLGFDGPEHREAALFRSVKWVHSGVSGYEHLLPLGPIAATVTNGKGALAPFLAETLIGAILALNGNFLGYIEQKARKVWNPLPFRSVSGRTLLIVGLGTIGSIVAARAQAIGMRVAAINRSGHSTPHVDRLYRPEQLMDALAAADVVSVHVRSTEETRHLIDARAFSAMKRGALFINTSRGAVVDEAALADALAKGHLGGAYLDVFAEEPLPKESALWEMSNVLITPHYADGVIDWASRLADLFADNLRRWNSGEPLINVIHRGSEN